MVRRIEKPADLETLERLDRARDFIDHCYDHPLSLEQISEKACFSRYHFLRLFREEVRRSRVAGASRNWHSPIRGVTFFDSQKAERERRTGRHPGTFPAGEGWRGVCY